MANSKTNFIFSLFFGLITFLALDFSICAQTVKIKQEDFSAALQKAIEQLKGKPQRIIYKSVTRLERSTSSFENVTEIIPPDKKRFLSKNTAEPVISGPEFTAEIIEIGEKRFTRKDNGAWTETSIVLKPENKIQSDKPQTEAVTDYYFLGEAKFDGKAADLYEFVTSNRLKIKQPWGEVKETLVLIKAKYWFGKNGLWIRDESEYEFSEPATNKVTHTQQMTRTYEYAPNLKIEAPKIN
jgi:hypothetical protein